MKGIQQKQTSLRKPRSEQPTFDPVSTLTSIKVFLYLYCAPTSPVESPPFFTAVDVRACTKKLGLENMKFGFHRSETIYIFFDNVELLKQYQEGTEGYKT